MIALPLYAFDITQLAELSDAVLEIVADVAHGTIQSGRRSPVAEKLVAICFPSIKREKIEDVGTREYVPIVQMTAESVTVTIGLVIGNIGGTRLGPHIFVLPLRPAVLSCV